MLNLDVADYENYINLKYNDTLNCDNTKVLVALDEAEQRVMEWVDVSACSCSCNRAILEEACYKYAYFRLNVSAYDEDDNYKEAERTAYRFLKNNGCINF